MRPAALSFARSGYQRSASALGSMPGWWTNRRRPSVAGARITAHIRSGAPRRPSIRRPAILGDRWALLIIRELMLTGPGAGTRTILAADIGVRRCWTRLTS